MPVTAVRVLSGRATSFEYFVSRVCANGKIEGLLSDLEPMLPYRSWNDGHNMTSKYGESVYQIDLGICQ